MNEPMGIDVSDNNGDFDWQPWAGHIQFGMVKCTEGATESYPAGYHDIQFSRNWAEMKDIGIYRFAYHYCIPDDDPAAQAALFVNTVKAHGLDEHDNFAADLEELSERSVSEVAFWLHVFTAEVIRLSGGHRCLVYTYPAFADQGACAMAGGHPLWIANYDVPSPDVPPPWRTWAFWQYTSGKLDHDVFNGTIEDLKKFCER
jgi:GH25 family lysozyme M1 (1,4-beta-N-acetylmuramidase)